MEIILAKKNTLFSFLSILLRLIANVIVFWAIARFYGPKNFGYFTFAHTLSSLAIIFADFGIDLFVTTEIAKNKKNAIEIFNQYFPLKIIIVAISIIIMWFITIFLDLEITGRIIIFLFCFFTAITAITNYFFAFFRANERIEYEYKVSLIYNLTLIIFTLFLVSIDADLIFITLLFVLTRIIGLYKAVEYYYAFKAFLKFSNFMSNIKKMQPKLLVYGIHLFFGQLFFQVDTLIINFLEGEYYVGIYQAAIRLILLPLILPDVLVYSLLPLLSRYYIENDEKYNKIGVYIAKILLFLGIMISSCIFLFSTQIIEYIYGIEQYYDSIIILKLFSIVLLIRFILEPFALLLTASDRQIIRMYTVIIASLFAVLLNYWWISKFGIIAAAYVAIIVNAFVGIVYIIANIRMFISFHKNINTFLLILFTIIVIVTSSLLNNISIFIIIPLYLTLFLCYGYFVFFSQEEKTILFAKK